MQVRRGLQQFETLQQPEPPYGLDFFYWHYGAGLLSSIALPSLRAIGSAIRDRWTYRFLETIGLTKPTFIPVKVPSSSRALPHALADLNQEALRRWSGYIIGKA